MTLEKEIKERIERQSNGHTSRNLSNYDILQREYSFGTRLYAVPKNNEVYRHVQDSRGFGSGPDATVSSIVEAMKNSTDMIEADSVRYGELCDLNKNIQLFDKSTGFFEIGFRSPKIMELIGKSHFMFTRGCDISRISVEACKILGYDVEEIDISKENFKMNLERVKLIVSYHVLEHIPDPISALKRIHHLSEHSSFLHIEVPIEPGMPRLKYAHMHEFQQYDLPKMLEEVGWKVLHHTHKTHSDGPFIDRCLAVKQ